MSDYNDFLTASDSESDSDVKYIRPVYLRKVPAIRTKRKPDDGHESSVAEKTEISSSKMKEGTQGPSDYGSICDTQSHYLLSAIMNDTDYGGASLLTEKPSLKSEDTHNGEQLMVPTVPHFDNQNIKNAGHHVFGHKREATYEYGASIEGYRFVGSREEADNFQEARRRTSHEAQAPVGDAVVNPLIFEGDGRRHQQRQGYLMRYLSSGADDMRVPMANAPLIDEVSADSLCSGDIESFLDKCASLLQISMREFLKQQRVAWHPDKVFRRNVTSNAGNLAVVTKVFQIVNSLWEAKQHCD
ncbi:LADA_0E05974g1_1 [Lachancea dasiensis]|uniref:LADA_0E05974g1_1 n=1 Tax=Lachancea dasiensis TaxID=1072105 RepID=A0A1G4JC98_9SACH|nr:LADA_0E05974g1_1 [Lachancea dasiensis]